MQGVIKSYDPVTGDGVVVRDTDFIECDLAANALEGSVFRFLRQGQRVIFDLDTDGRATALRLGSGTPEETLMVGDNISADIEGGRAVGLRPVLIDRSDTPAEPPEGAVLVTSLLDLPLEWPP